MNTMYIDYYDNVFSFLLCILYCNKCPCIFMNTSTSFSIYYTGGATASLPSEILSKILISLHSIDLWLPFSILNILLYISEARLAVASAVCLP